MTKVYKVLSTLMHDGVKYLPGSIIQDIDGLESLVELGVLKVIDGAESAEEAVAKDVEAKTAEGTADTKPANTWGPAEAPADGTEAKTQSMPVVGSGDVDPAEGKQVDPDTGANLG